MNTQRIVSASIFHLALVILAAPGLAAEGRAWGDIHVRTMDGAIYPFQSTGEYVASRSTQGDLEVQLRLESAGFSSDVSIATVVAVRIGATRASVALGREPMLSLDQRPTSLAPGETHELGDGGWIERSKRDYVFHWSDGSMLTVDVRRSHLNAFLLPAETRRETLSGLFGNFNGRAGDDVDLSTVSSGGASLSRAERSLTDLAKRLLLVEADASLVTQEQSLFEYEPGQSTRTFRRPKSGREVSARTLPASRRRHAKETCEKVGVTDAELLEACIVDVGYTRDESFAETAAAVQERDVAHWDESLAKRSDPGF